MTEGVVVALIGAVATVLVALIGLVGKRKKSSGESDDGKKITIKQKAEGANSTQIGIQINNEKSDNRHE